MPTIWVGQLRNFKCSMEHFISISSTQSSIISFYITRFSNIYKLILSHRSKKKKSSMISVTFHRKKGRQMIEESNELQTIKISI